MRYRDMNRFRCYQVQLQVDDQVCSRRRFNLQAGLPDCVLMYRRMKCLLRHKRPASFRVASRAGDTGRFVGLTHPKTSNEEVLAFHPVNEVATGSWRCGLKIKEQVAMKKVL